MFLTVSKSNSYHYNWKYS